MDKRIWEEGTDGPEMTAGVKGVNDAESAVTVRSEVSSCLQKNQMAVGEKMNS
jgi:hypothetical protein